MDATRFAGVVMLLGSVLFLVGAAVGVPRIFTEPDPEARLRLLREHPTAWRVAQPMYGGGALIAGAGAFPLGAGTPDATARALLVASGTALVVGALAWCRSLYLRATRPPAFVHGELPGWPFATYVLLTVAGLALLGAGLLTAGGTAWLGWLTIVAAAAFLAGYLRFHDLPPFVFYLLLLLVGGVAAAGGAG